MKHFNEEFEAVIYTETVSCVASPKVGDVVPHMERVSYVKIYYQEHQEQQPMKISLSKGLITALYKQIEGIESRQFDMQYEKELPF